MFLLKGGKLVHLQLKYNMQQAVVLIVIDHVISENQSVIGNEVGSNYCVQPPNKPFILINVSNIMKYKKD